METLNGLHWRTKNLIGQRFGRLTVVEFVGYGVRNKFSHKSIWRCKCDCGKVVEKSGNDLTGSKVKSCGCAHFRLPHGEAAFNDVFYSYRRNAKNRGLVFELNKWQAKSLFSGNCFYCGVKPSNKHSSRGLNGDFVFNGIDRVNNDKGYVFDNCVTCCETCNKAKLQMTFDEFKAWIDRVYHNLNK